VLVAMTDALDASDQPRTTSTRETRRLLTAELVMAQAGDYDLYSMKEVCGSLPSIDRLRC
jgi:hypothetical protein